MTSIETKPTPAAAVRPALTAIPPCHGTDAETSATWYERVLGFQRQFEERHYRSDAGGYTIEPGSRSPPSELRGQLRPGPNRARPPVLPSGLGRCPTCVGGAPDSQDVPNSGVYPMESFPLSLE